MSHPYSFSDCTSANLEKVALTRFRDLVQCLPKDCRVFREPWDCSTILCVDVGNCSNFFPEIQQQAALLVNIAQELGLANAIIFRMGNRFMGWSGPTPENKLI